MPTALLLDCGETLVDELTEIKNEFGESLRAELIPGADRLVIELKQRGCALALCADGPVATFENVLTQHGLYGYFDAFEISETVGVDKPDARMFQAALDGLNIAPVDYAETIMVGNNLERDIVGANAFGLTTVFLAWSNKRRKTPEYDLEKPDYTIQTPLELLYILDHL